MQRNFLAHLLLVELAEDHQHAAAVRPVGEHLRELAQQREGLVGPAEHHRVIVAHDALVRATQRVHAEAHVVDDDAEDDEDLPGVVKVLQTPLPVLLPWCHKTAAAFLLPFRRAAHVLLQLCIEPATHAKCCMATQPKKKEAAKKASKEELKKQRYPTSLRPVFGAVLLESGMLDCDWFDCLS